MLKSLIYLYFSSIFFVASFWKEIPSRCVLNENVDLICRNATFVFPIPEVFSLQKKFSKIEIRNSIFHYSFRDVFLHVSNEIENLTLIENRFSLNAVKKNSIFEGSSFFRSLSTLKISDRLGRQWIFLNKSIFPVLIDLDLSKNGFDENFTLIFDEKSFPKLKTIDLSENKLRNIKNLHAEQIQRLILASNPIETIDDQIERFPLLEFLDLSSTNLRNLFPISVLPKLRTFRCEKCSQIHSWNIERFLFNCSKISVDFSGVELSQIEIFNPFAFCFENIFLNGKNSIESISTEDFLQTHQLKRIEFQRNHFVEFIFLNVYENLNQIDFSSNPYLNRVILRLRSDTTRLERLTISQTALTDFSVDFDYSKLKYCHIDYVDLSRNKLETIDFLKYLTFFTLDVSSNQLKIIDIEPIVYSHGMYNLASMNLFNASHNEMEYFKMNWLEESPHKIDLSNNRLEYVEVHGQSTLSIDLSNNRNLSFTPDALHLNLTALQDLSLTSIELISLENLIYFHNLSQIRTLIIENNQLDRKHRTLNWQLFDPWRQYLTHLSLKNLSLERFDSGAYLDDYIHLLTIDITENDRLKCDCSLKPLMNWLRTPPPLLSDFHEPLEKILRTDCPVSLLYLHCQSNNDHETDLQAEDKSHSYTKTIRFILVLFLVSTLLFCFTRLIDRRWCIHRTKFYRQVHTDANMITLNERNLQQREENY